MVCIIECKDRSGSEVVVDRSKGLLLNFNLCLVVFGVEDIFQWFGEFSCMGLKFVQLINYFKEFFQFLWVFRDCYFYYILDFFCG